MSNDYSINYHPHDQQLRGHKSIEGISAGETKNY